MRVPSSNLTTIFSHKMTPIFKVQIKSLSHEEILHAFCGLLIFFSKSTFSKKKSRMGTDLCPNCLQKLSADDIRR